MNIQSNAMPESPVGSQGITPAVMSATRPLYWSIRRELWEYRSIYLAPLAIAGVILLGSVFFMAHLPQTMRAAMALDPAEQRDALAHPYDIAAGLIMGAAFLVSIFYSIDALYGERRERSILFWKSLPVSDLTTVLAKASIPLLVLPMVACAVTVITELILLFFSSLVLLGSGLSVASLWRVLALPHVGSLLLYHIVTVHILWYAPLYAWLLLVSAWARRAPFLWVVLPPFGIFIFEKVAFHTSYFCDFLRSRVSGGTEAMNNMQGNFPLDPGLHLTPGMFLVTPGLWLGLIFAAAFLYAAARLRRYQGPM